MAKRAKRPTRTEKKIKAIKDGKKATPPPSKYQKRQEKRGWKKRG